MIALCGESVGAGRRCERRVDLLDDDDRALLVPDDDPELIIGVCIRHSLVGAARSEFDQAEARGQRAMFLRAEALKLPRPHL